MNNKCNCSDDVLCSDAKKLWKLKSFKGRKKYSDHRLNALGLMNDMGYPKMQGNTIWANNLK